MSPGRAFSMRLHLLLGICMGLVSSGCSPRQLPAPQPPDRALPVLLGPPPPLGAGMGRVVLDVVDGPAAVERVTGRTAGRGARGAELAWTPSGIAPVVPFGNARYDEETRALLCQSPCALDLPYGVHPIVLTTDDGRTNTIDLPVLAKPRVVRLLMMSETRHGALRAVGWGATAVGIGALIAGGALVGMTASRAEGSGTSLMAGSAVAFLVGGAGLTILGVVLLERSRPEVRPGAITEFELPADAYGH